MGALYKARAPMIDPVKIAKDFATPQALKEYLHDHPGADRSKHHVEKKSPGEAHPKEDGKPSKDEKSEEHGHGEKKVEPKKSLKERLKSLSDKAQSFLKESPKEVHKFLTDDAHRRKTLQNASKALESVPEKVVKNIVKTVKEEVHEFKEAGAGVKAVLSGKKMNDHQKKALKTVAFHVSLTVVATALTVSGGPLAGLAAFGKSMAKHVAMKSASNAIGHIHILEELGHVGHGIQHLVDKLAAEKDVDPDDLMVRYVMALTSKELSKLNDDSVLEMAEEASKDKSDKEATYKVACRFANSQGCKLDIATSVASKFAKLAGK